MSKIKIFVFTIIFIFSVFSLFQIKFKVQNLNRELIELKTELAHEKNAIHILKAEWAYLNNPHRLQRLAEKFLELEELKPNQIITSESFILAKSNNIENNSMIIKTSLRNKKVTKWRYKDRPDLKSKK